MFRSKTAKVPGRWGIVKAEKGSTDNRCVVSFKDRSAEEKEVRSSRLLPVYRMKPEMMAIVTATTKDFRQACVANVAPDDLVLEIGSSYGEASVALLRHCGHLIGLDVSAEAVSSSKERCKEFVQEGKADFQVVDIFKEPDRAITIVSASCDAGGPAVICIDIGGNRDLFSVVRMVRWAEITFRPKLIIIKSEEMAWNGTGRDEFQAIRDRKMHDRGRKRKQQEPSSTGNVTSLTDGVAGEEETAVVKSSAALLNVQIRDDGIIENGDMWWENLRNNVRCPAYKHPLQAPLHTGPDGVAICRYHNYHASGCQKGQECEFRHDLCHLCRKSGHIARNCDVLLCDLI